MSVCPASGHTANGSMGPRGCAFLGNMSQSSSATLWGAPQGPNTMQMLRERELKTIGEVLCPVAPSKEKTRNMTNTDALNPSSLDVLAVALGAPARRVLERAEAVGPATGWRDGYLSSTHGFVTADTNAAPAALALTPGRVWADLCTRLPGVIARGRVREAILELPLIDASQATIPDPAIWAACTCLGILCSIYRYEERNDGRDGIIKGARKEDFTNVSGETDDEPETIGIPRNVALPFRQICTRLGRPLPFLSQSELSLSNYKIRDPTSAFPYLERAENMDLRWPIFNDRSEAMFLLCMVELHGLFIPGPDLLARCQERVMMKDNDGLLVELVKLKHVIDQLSYVFHKISVNPRSGENFANPTFWGQGFAKFSAPLSKRVPALSGLFMPIFHVMDAFLMRSNYQSFLGVESLHLRAWLPLNIRAFIAALENHFPIVPYIRASRDPRLLGVLEAIVESYTGERGFMGTHRYKVYGFLELVSKTGRVETNGSSGAGDTIGRPWLEVHKALADSMKERLEPYRSQDQLNIQPHEMRGSYDECRFWAKISHRSAIDDDPTRSTGKVTFDLKNVGLTFIPGDRLAIMPLNSWADIEKVIGSLGLHESLDTVVPLTGAAGVRWSRYARHEADVSKKDPNAEPQLTVRDILRKGRLAPLTKEMVMGVHSRIRVSPTVLRVLGSGNWPVNGSLGDLLIAALNDVSQEAWESAFSLDDLSWLQVLVTPEVPRTYSIASYSMDLIPESLDLTVARAEHEVSPLLLPEGVKQKRPGVCSGFLNPNPTSSYENKYPQTSKGMEEEQVLVGISRPLNFQLPISPSAPVAMFAGGSGIAPFRGFWQARVGSGAIGRNILFLGVQSRQKFLYKHELRDYVKSGKLELHVAFSRDNRGLVFDPYSRDLVEKIMEPRYINATISDQGPTVCDIIISTRLGGLGGYIFICGSASLYETVMSGIREALYKYRAVTSAGADELLAQAFAERRCMLDIFMTPRAMSENEPWIPLSELSRHTGHHEGDRMWIAVHGSVYDVTEFLPIHPGGTLIVSGSAGLDASATFNEVAHTTNPEVMSLLGKYFVGYLTPKPNFQLSELNEIYDGWVDYMRTCVESLTTLYFEVDTLLKDTKMWFSEGLLSTHAIRKFYQLQSRLLSRSGFSVLFGSKIQELYLKLSFTIASYDDDPLLPDVIGTVTYAASSPAAMKARKEVAELGEFVSSSATSAPAFEKGIIAYAQGVCELSVRFLEQVREEICLGYDTLLRLAEAIKTQPHKERQVSYKVASALVGYLERIAERVSGFYVDLASLSMYHPELEANPARARWKSIQRRIKDGSLFFLAEDAPTSALEIDLDAPLEGFGFGTAKLDRKGSKLGRRISVKFDQVLSQAVSSVGQRRGAGHNRMLSAPDGIGRARSRARGVPDIQEVPENEPMQTRPLRLADAHTARAQNNGVSSYEEQEFERAQNGMTQFMSKRAKDLRRMSKRGDLLTLDRALDVYGSSGGSSGGLGSPRPGAQAHRRIESESGLPDTANRLRATPPSTPPLTKILMGPRTPSLTAGGKPPVAFAVDPRTGHRRQFSRQQSLDKLNGFNGAKNPSPPLKSPDPPVLEINGEVATSFKGSPGLTPPHSADFGTMSKGSLSADLLAASLNRRVSIHRGARTAPNSPQVTPVPLNPPTPPSHW